MLARRRWSCSWRRCSKQLAAALRLLLDVLQALGAAVGIAPLHLLDRSHLGKQGGRRRAWGRGELHAARAGAGQGRGQPQERAGAPTEAPWPWHPPRTLSCSSSLRSSARRAASAFRSARMRSSSSLFCRCLCSTCRRARLERPSGAGAHGAGWPALLSALPSQQHPGLRRQRPTSLIRASSLRCASLYAACRCASLAASAAARAASASSRAASRARRRSSLCCCRFSYSSRFLWWWWAWVGGEPGGQREGRFVHQRLGKQQAPTHSTAPHLDEGGVGLLRRRDACVRLALRLGIGGSSLLRLLACRALPLLVTLRHLSFAPRHRLLRGRRGADSGACATA